MNSFVKIAALCFTMMLVASPAMAQDAASTVGPMNLGSALGAGLVILGAGYGIGKIGSALAQYEGVQQRGGPDRRCHVLRVDRLYVVQHIRLKRKTEAL